MLLRSPSAYARYVAGVPGPPNWGFSVAGTWRPTISSTRWETASTRPSRTWERILAALPHGVAWAHPASHNGRVRRVFGCASEHFGLTSDQGAGGSSVDGAYNVPQVGGAPRRSCSEKGEQVLPD